MAWLVRGVIFCNAACQKSYDWLVWNCRQISCSSQSTAQYRPKRQNMLKTNISFSLRELTNWVVIISKELSDRIDTCYYYYSFSELAMGKTDVCFEPGPKCKEFHVKSSKIVDSPENLQEIYPTSLLWNLTAGFWIAFVKMITLTVAFFAWVSRTCPFSRSVWTSFFVLNC